MECIDGRRRVEAVGRNVNQFQPSDEVFGTLGDCGFGTKESPSPESLAFTEEEIPSYFLRMKSAALASRRQLPKVKVLIMDTSPAAILGCLKDPVVEKADPVLAINVGNGHTMAAIISEGKIVGVMEHHTRLLNPEKIEQLLVSFGDGKLSDEEVFKDRGHGLFFLSEPPGFSKIELVAATGPNRNVLAKTNLSVHFATPAGDVMMTGPMGLVQRRRSISLPSFDKASSCSLPLRAGVLKLLYRFQKDVFESIYSYCSLI